MWRSVFLAWLFGESVDDEISPWVHAFTWARLEEEFEHDPRRPTDIDLVELLNEADRSMESAFTRTFGWRRVKPC